MPYKLPDDRMVTLGMAFAVAGVQYPANWLQLSSPEERAALGLVEVIYEPRPDDQFYFVTANDDGTYSTQPKPIADLKQRLVEQVKAAARARLDNYNWKLMREISGGGALSEEDRGVMAAIRSHSNTLEDQISALTTVEAVAGWQQAGWPTKD